MATVGFALLCLEASILYAPTATLTITAKTQDQHFKEA